MCPISDPSTEHGITWLQLFAVFMLNGGCNAAASAVGRLSARLKFAPVFKQFIRDSKALFAYFGHEFMKLLRPLRNDMRPLSAYGIYTFMPMLSCNLALAGEAAQALHAATCAIVAKLGAGNRVPNRIKVGPLKLPKFSPWDSLRYSDILAQRATRMLSADFAGNRSEFCEFGGADPRARVDRPSSYPLYCLSVALVGKRPMPGSIRQRAAVR